ncbi:CrcB family protein [Synechococcus sp. CBW1002]|uniref:FluC/FEX family fluoride channel n=1 Tax=Synechococcus sp. CBW1002 TaxID=1353134 RepID=UPI001E580086|nr:CrcB family protein [Synechococcus sp. CBW1002]
MADPDLLRRRRLRFALRELALVGLGAVPGAWLRWQAGLQLGPWLGGTAWTNVLVNLVGSFLLGLLSGPIPRRTTLLLALGVGFCGALTTFSSWMLDLVRLLQTAQPRLALLLLLGSLAGGVAAAALGLATSRRLWRA